jgi:integrase
MSDKLNPLSFILPEETQVKVTEWDIERLPSVVAHLPKEASAWSGENDIPKMVIGFRAYIRQRSTRTKQQYEWDVKQFLLWCNAIHYNVLSRVITTIEMRDIASVYNEILKRQDFKRNTVALKMQGVRKFFEYLNSTELKMDIRAAFNPSNITTSDPKAYKTQPRINDEIYNSVMRHVHEHGTKNEKWIFFFLAWGCRKSEIVNAKVTDINMVEKVIRPYMKKVNDTKTLPLPSWFTGMQEFSEGQGFIVKYDDVGEYKPDSKKFQKLNQRTKDRILMNGKIPVNDQYIYDTIQRWFSKTKFADSMKSAPPHSFRRQFVNSMRRQGFSDSEIADAGGWANTAMIQLYGKDNDLKNNRIVSGDAVKYDELNTQEKPDEKP